MARSSIYPTTAIPEADLLEQQALATQDPLIPLIDDQHQLTDGPVTADEADLLDQVSLLPDDDAENYPNAYAGEGLDA